MIPVDAATPPRYRILLALLVVLSFLPATPSRTAGPGGTEYARYLSEHENAILREHNLARSDPAGYAKIVAEWRDYYRGRRRFLPGRLPVWTNEGVEAVEEAIRFLLVQEPVPPLAASQGLSRAARDHVRDTGPNGGMGHIGSDRTEPADRVSRYGKWYGRVGENITYGGYDARELIIRLIIDDGIEDRGHRRNLFNPQYRLAGVSFGDHRGYRTMCVITYAAEFEENTDAQ